MKKLIMVLLSLVLMISVCIPVNAANMITYTIYNEAGEIIEEGSFDPYSRKSWDTDITLKSGYSMDFKNESNAFYVANGASLKLTYTLNTSGTVACQFMKTTSATGVGSTWSSTTKTGSSGTVTKTADATAYYYPRIYNTGSNTITITKVILLF